MNLSFENDVWVFIKYCCMSDPPHCVGYVR